MALTLWSAVSLPSMQPHSAHLRYERRWGAHRGARERAEAATVGGPMNTAQPSALLPVYRLRGGAEDAEGEVKKHGKGGSIPHILSGFSNGVAGAATSVSRIPSLTHAMIFNRTSNQQGLNPLVPASPVHEEDRRPPGSLTPSEEYRVKKKRKSWPVRQRLWASFTDVITALAALEQAPGTLMKSKADEKALFLKSLWHGFLPVMAYATCSIYMVISQAYVLRHKRSAGINYSTLLLMYQNLCGICLYFAEDLMGRQPFAFFEVKAALQMLPNSALFAIMVSRIYHLLAIALNSVVDCVKACRWMSECIVKRQ